MTSFLSYYGGRDEGTDGGRREEGGGRREEGGREVGRETGRQGRNQEG